jgi:hypothetical protein
VIRAVQEMDGFMALQTDSAPEGGAGIRGGVLRRRLTPAVASHRPALEGACTLRRTQGLYRYKRRDRGKSFADLLNRSEASYLFKTGRV